MTKRELEHKLDKCERLLKQQSAVIHLLTTTLELHRAVRKVIEQ